jgi:deoxyribodipyrimidine photo-lyase
MSTIDGIKRSLFWREFYHIIHKYYSTEQFRYKNIKWKGSDIHFRKWCKGETGYPIVDANMRMLNSTGYMSNRGRLITASFLVKLLLVDWRKGERYFATKLIDYDIANNNGNWQWVAGTGSDVQPYFRIFNPWIQSKKFDKDAEFIKYWIPELNTVPPKHIHLWEEVCNNEDYKNIKYTKPIIKYKENKDKSLQMYKSA